MTPQSKLGKFIKDLGAASVGVFVVGFGGVARREAVMRGADIFVAGPSLRAVLDVILSAEEQERLIRNDRRVLPNEN